MSVQPPSDPFPYPRQLVVGVIGGKAGGERASESLRGVGFGPDSIVVLHGEQDLADSTSRAMNTGWAAS
jgi:NAD(P)H-dependent FMN reductase